MSAYRTLTSAEPRPDASAGPLPAWARAAAESVDLTGLNEVVVDRDLQAAFPSLIDHVEFVERLRASVTENLQALQDVLCGRLALDEVRLTEPFVLAAVQAQMRIPQTSLQHSYRVGFAAMWQEWAERLSSRAEQDDVPRAEALSGLQTLTNTILDYQDHVASQVAESYARADDSLGRSRVHVRGALVRQLLHDGALPLSPADQVTLDYPFSANHVAVLLPDVSQATAERLLRGLQTVTHPSGALVNPVDMTSTVMWLAKPGAWPGDALDALHERLQTLEVQASISDSRPGADGIRETWDQVQEVERIRRGWASAPTRVLRHADVGLEVLLMRDPARAKEFVTNELGALGADSEQARRLRDTLDASFRCGSHVATAELLHLHEHSVRNRLQKAEQLLGRPLHQRRTELQVALRLSRVLEPPTRDGGSTSTSS